MRLLYSLLALVVICIVGCAAVESENEMEIAVSQAPKAAVKAAQDAVPGITLTEAEVEEEDGRTVYEFEGKTADGTEYEIEVTADGKVLEVEKDDDGDDDDHDDDDDK